MLSRGLHHNSAKNICYKIDDLLSCTFEVKFDYKSDKKSCVSVAIPVG